MRSILSILTEKCALISSLRPLKGSICCPQKGAARGGPPPPPSFVSCATA